MVNGKVVTKEELVLAVKNAKIHVKILSRASTVNDAYKVIQDSLVKARDSNGEVIIESHGSFAWGEEPATIELANKLINIRSGFKTASVR